MNIKELVKNQNAHFVFFRDQALYYETDNGFQFPVPVGDAGSATFNHEEKAILLMRYIRKEDCGGATRPGQWLSLWVTTSPGHQARG